MEVNSTRWCYYKSNDVSATTIYIENKPFSFVLGYRTMHNAHLFTYDFQAFFKCILLTKYFKIEYKNIKDNIEKLKAKNNTLDLSFRKDAEFSPIMCIKNDEIYYHVKTKCLSEQINGYPKIVMRPSLKDFIERLDYQEILNFFVVYLRQKNLKMFHHIFKNIIQAIYLTYLEYKLHEEEFFLRISPAIEEFFLSDSLINYVHTSEIPSILV